MELTRRQIAKLLLGAASAPAALRLSQPGVANAAQPHGADTGRIPANSSFIDARGYDGAAEIDCDLCIVGAGAAGITLALKLARPGRRSIVIESGGLEFDGATQALYKGTTTGQPYFTLASCRLRYFGGTTNHWGGFCVVPERVDFEGRPDAGVPAWPISYDETIQYVHKAAEQLGHDPAYLEPLRHPDAPRADLPSMVDSKSGIVRTQTDLLSLPRHRLFNRRYRAGVGALPDAKVFLNANLTHIQMAESGATVKHLTVKTLTGKSLMIRPRITVLACHAIENARLLLASNDIVRAGLGNAGDHLGRHFMDHLHITAGRVMPSTEESLLYYYRDPILPKAQRAIQSLIAIKEPMLRANAMLEYCAQLKPSFEPELESTGKAVSRLIKAFFQPFDEEIAADMATMLGNPASATASALARFGLRERRPLSLDIEHTVAQSPNPSSRVTITAERDRLGVPAVSLNWAISDYDIHSFIRGQRLLVDEITRMGLGTVKAEPLSPEFVRRNVAGHWHHMGTTRMSAAASEGVVDTNCRVHGTDNLYVAGSGLFPNTTAGSPTMLLIALALRLADHLDARMLA